MNPEETPATTPQTPATLEERVNAIEAMLGHLIFLMEVEPNFTAQTLLDWIAVCRERERAHGIADARAQVVFSQLCERLQLVESDQGESDPAAKQAAHDALAALRRKPPQG